MRSAPSSLDRKRKAAQKPLFHLMRWDLKTADSDTIERLAAELSLTTIPTPERPAHRLDARPPAGHARHH